MLLVVVFSLFHNLFLETMPYPYRARLLTRLAILLCASFVPLAASAQQSKPPAAAGRKMVCVASAIGHKYELKTIGLMVFGNDSKSAAIDAWGIDGLVVQRVSAGLGSHFSVRPVTLPAGALAGFAPGPNLFGRHDEALRSHIRSNTKAGCAYYVVAAPFTGQFPDTNQTITGLGIVKSDRIIETYFVDAVFSLQIYDGQTTEWIRQSIDGGEIIASAFSGPSWLEKVDQTYWPATPEATVGHAKLRDATRSHVAKLVNKYTQRVLATLTRSD